MHTGQTREGIIKAIHQWRLMQDKIVVFQDKNVRRIWHHEEWYFSVIDVVNALDASTIPKRYWSDLKSKLSAEGFEPYDKIVQLKLPSEDGKSRKTDCANTKNMFRIIQSIPSQKAEPFKRWLAQVGYERVQEIEDPELAQQRTRSLYKQKGHSDAWIEKRMRGIAIRDELTGEWEGEIVFKDVGAIVYFLRATPWLVDKFSVKSHLKYLERLQDKLDRNGRIIFTLANFMMLAKKV